MKLNDNLMYYSGENHINKVEDSSTLIIDNLYWVYCYFTEELIHDPISQVTSRTYQITPVYRNAHNDPESGQDGYHYHQDMRWKVKPTSKSVIVNRLRITELAAEFYDHFELMCIRTGEIAPTPVELVKSIPPEKYIGKSKVCMYPANHKCIHKGFDLRAQKEDDYGLITCLLHSLKYIKS